jgi:hypothetical protein
MNRIAIATKNQHVTGDAAYARPNAIPETVAHNAADCGIKPAVSGGCVTFVAAECGIIVDRRPLFQLHVKTQGPHVQCTREHGETKREVLRCGHHVQNMNVYHTSSFL